jgi:AcrR family transcriptional regulator
MPKALKTRPKQVRNATQTKARILREATQIFAGTGYDGASISDIVKASQINKRMIYHYFGDKEGLYRAVFLHQWGELKDWFDRAVKKRFDDPATTSLTVEQLLTEAIDTLFDFMASHPHFVRLMMWEGLEGGAISRSIWKQVRGPIYVQLEFLIKQAQEEKVLDSKLEPSHLIISFLGAVGFYFAYAPTLFEIIRKNPFSEPALEERKNQLKFMLTSLFTK